MAAPGFKLEVKDTDMGFDDMVRGAESFLSQPYIKVGVIGNATHGDGLTVVDVATFHEFGTETIPQRSFIRATVDEGLKSIQDEQDKIIDRVLFQGANFDKEAGKLGLAVQSKIQQKILSRIPPALKPATIRAKGSDVPLVDTGQLVRSVSFEVGKE